MATNKKAADFLKAMSNKPEEATAEMAPPPLKVVPKAVPAAAAPDPAKTKATVSRADRKQLMHFGGYLDEATMETVALLRLRLKVDNSQLIKLAIEELSRAHRAKKAFGDA